MKTYYRKCIKDLIIKDGNKVFTLEKGKEYLTSHVFKGQVTVLTNYWVPIPCKEYFKECKPAYGTKTRKGEYYNVCKKN